MNNVNLDHNKYYYKKTYNQIHASCELQERLMNMGKEKGIQEETVGRPGKRKWQKPVWKVAITAAALAIVLPTGAFAANKLSDFLFEGKATQNNYEVDISVKQQAQPTQEGEKEKLSAVKDAGPVTLTGTNLPGYTMSSKGSQDNGWYDFSSEGGFSSGKEFSVEIIKVDTNADKGLFIQNVTASKEITLNGHKAISIHRNSVVGSIYNENTEYTRRVVVFYEDLGYILHFYAQEGITEDTLIKYAKQITLKECAEKNACGYITLTQYMDTNRDCDNTEVKIEVTNNQIYHIGEPVTYEGITYEVQKVEVTDSIQDILEEKGNSIRSDIKYLKKLADKDGQLKSYTRETLETGNGKDKPWAKVTGTQEIALKFVRLTAHVKNNSKSKAKDVQVCMPLISLQNQNGKFYRYVPEYGVPKAVAECQTDFMPEYFQKTKGGQHFYFKKLQPGEEATIHLGYFVDEDMLNRMAINMEYWDTTDDGEAYIDISQK